MTWLMTEPNSLRSSGSRGHGFEPPLALPNGPDNREAGSDGKGAIERNEEEVERTPRSPLEPEYEIPHGCVHEAGKGHDCECEYEAPLAPGVPWRV